MARGEGEVESRQGGAPGSMKSHFVERVTKLPVFNVAWDYATNTYSTIKESNRLVNFTLTNAERSVNFMADQAKPVVLRFGKQIQVVDDFAYKSLGTLEEKVPIITKRPEQIIGDTRKLYTDAVHGRVEGLKKYGSNTVKRISDYGYQTASLVLGENVVNSVLSSVDGVLVMTEHYVDRILPPGEDENAKENHENHCDYQNNVDKDSSDEHPSTVARITRIASVIQHRVYRITLIKVNDARSTFMEVFNLPEHMLAFAFQNLEVGSLYFQRLWEVLNDEKAADTDDKNVPLKRILPVLRPIFKRLLSLQQRLTSSKDQKHHESNNVGNDTADGGNRAVETLTDSIIQMVGLFRAIPALAPLYLLSVISWFIPEGDLVTEAKYRQDNEEEEMIAFEEEVVAVLSFMLCTFYTNKDILFKELTTVSKSEVLGKIKYEASFSNTYGLQVCY